MIRLDTYGRRIEEYAYSFDDKDYSVKEISYTAYDKAGMEVMSVGVYNYKGQPRQAIVIEPNPDRPNDQEQSFQRSVPEMKLYLNEIGREVFSFKDCTVHKCHTGEDYFTLSVPVGKLDYSFVFDKGTAAVYSKRANVIRLFKDTNDGVDYSSLLEEIYITDFGFVTYSNEEDKIEVNKIKSNSDMILSYTTNEYEPIECLQQQCDKVLITSNDDSIMYNISYDSDNMVQSVITSDGKYVSREEMEEAIFKNHGLYGTYIDSIYPVLITSNIEDYRYNFMNLWCHDRMKKDSKNKIYSFERDIYFIGSEKISDLIEKLTSSLDKLIINY